ncbi:MAG: ApaG domain, partial [Proteobacteria bacterium]|nr:ApaG domain [Pseudomonadota bacterium]
MSDKPFKPSLVGIHVKTAFLPAHSNPQHDQYTFAYSITISNASDLPVQLMSRHWVITDAGGRVQEV